jgi:PKD repeat protein
LNPSSGLNPLTVQFTDTSIGNPVSWYWTFGDGQTSQMQNPSHTYPAPGSYTTTLVVWFPWGSPRALSKVVTVLPSLKPGFIVNSRIGYEPYTVRFTDLTTGGPTSWLWVFGDGTTSTVHHPTHTFTDAGTYSVKLTVSNAVAGTKTATKLGYVRVLPLSRGVVLAQAEDYDPGGEGVAYHDTTFGNSVGAYRPNESVDITAFGSGRYDGGFAVTDIMPGEWLRYWIWSPAPANRDFPLVLRVARGNAPGQRTVTISADGVGSSSEVSIPYTGSVSSFTNVTTSVRLKPGANEVRFAFSGDGYASTLFYAFTIDPSLEPSEVPPPWSVSIVPGGSAVPQSIRTDTKYDDVNGNYRLDFADVMLYFNQLEWIAANEPVELFDYNENGRIDFADVTWLFRHL